MKIIIFCLMFGYVHSATWTYEGDKGTTNWPKNYPTCNGSRQSPINIKNPQYMEFDPFEMDGYDNMASQGLTLLNNGHTAQIKIENPGNTTLSGGGLNGTYVALQLHFHWGKNDGEGSEHLYNNRKYPLELHIVHYKTAYGTVSNALTKGDGLAVLGFMFVTDDAEDNPDFEPLITALDQIREKDSQTSVNIDFSKFMPEKKTEFYRYMGGLTTPGCDQIVVWTVFENKNTISSTQLAKFRRLLADKTDVKNTIAWNYRPPQALAGRTVYKNFMPDIPPSWHWGYEGHEGAKYWPDYYDTCTGAEQSPIDIPHWDKMEYQSKYAKFNESLKLDSLEFRNYDKPITGTIKNNGHTIQVDIDDGLDIHLLHGNLPDKYIAKQFHFHWGRDDSTGSEHTLESKAYALELHIVHYKAAYQTFENAVEQKDGLAVAGFFFVGGGAILNNNYDNIVDQLQYVKYKGASRSVSGFSLQDLTYESNLRLNNETGQKYPYYRYTGGLTTPPCYQIVTWSVMREPIYIPAAQIAAFRDVSHIESGTIGPNDKIKLNYRPVQNLAGRDVHLSHDLFQIYTAGTSGLLPSILCMAAILFSVALL